MKPFLMVIISAAVLASNVTAGTIAPGLEDLLSGKEDHEIVKVLVVMQDRPDVRTLDKNLVSQGVIRASRHRSVVQTLQRAAKDSQRDLLYTLGTAKAAGGVVGYVPHWIVNGIVLTATVATVRDIALRTDVERIEPDLVPELIEPVSVKEIPMGMHRQSADKDAAGFVTPGLPAINADRVWHELGIDGTGAIVANMDSGVDGNHPMLTHRWRGNFAPAAECWQDHGDVGSPDVPVDVYGHGTHVMGTITGVGSADTVGVAPGATWIATNAIWSTSETLDNQVIAAFEWLADPDGDPTTGDDVPDVVQNSWGVNPSSGVYLDCDTRWYDVIDNCEAAGVVVLWSAGNEGPGPGSLRTPPNRADTPTSSFSIGSTRTSFPYQLSSFSARGPSQCGGPYAIKPEVVAPGQDILSCYPGGAMAYMSGTSMAGPHVAGVVALMRQARPDVDVITIKEILMETALDLGFAGEDNEYGHGLVDAYAAVLTVLEEVGTVTGTVTDATDGLPLDQVVVSDLNGLNTKYTAADGTYTFSVRAGERPITMEKFGYVTAEFDLPVVAGETVVHDRVLERTPWSTVSGVVRGPDGQPYPGAVVTVLDVPLDPMVTGADGSYQLQLPAGEGLGYDLLATAPDLAYDLRHVGLEQNAVLDFALPNVRSDGFETGDFGSLPYTHAGDAAWTIGGDEATEGVLSARSGAVDHGQETVLELDYYVNGPGEFSFWHMTDSEPSYDVLAFAIDGVTVGSWSGARDWTRYAADLATGLHTFRWTYRKDGSASVNRDAAWIDHISFPGTGVQPFPDLVLDRTSIAATVTAGSTTVEPLTLTNAGTYQLDYTATVADMPVWLGITPAGGGMFPFNDTVIELEFNGTAAPAGTHQFDLVLASNDPDTPEVTVPVTLTVSAVSAAGDVVPERPTLRGAVPNPFNPATDVSFSLPAATRVSLRIYDVSGRLVRTLVTGRREAGVHRERWNGRDEGGQGVASGVYFARLQADGVTQVTRMSLVR